MLVKDIQPGTGSSGPLALTPLGNMVIFGAWDASGQGMWRSDGTAEGTIFLARVQPVVSDPWPPRFTEVNGNLMFFGSSANERRELWFTNGTPSGTRMVTILPGSGPDSPRWPVVANNRIFFAHNDEMHGQELWRSDLTAAGTALVRDINTER
jgi:ELWxxDGT repeat protein